MKPRRKSRFSKAKAKKVKKPKVAAKNRRTLVKSLAKSRVTLAKPAPKQPTFTPEQSTRAGSDLLGVAWSVSFPGRYAFGTEAIYHCEGKKRKLRAVEVCKTTKGMETAFVEAGDFEIFASGDAYKAIGDEDG